MAKAFGWTVIRRDSAKGGYHVYPRGCPADKANWAEDLAPFTFPTKAKAIEQGKLGNFANHHHPILPTQGIGW